MQHNQAGYSTIITIHVYICIYLYTHNCWQNANNWWWSTDCPGRKGEDSVACYSLLGNLIYFTFRGIMNEFRLHSSFSRRPVSIKLQVRQNTPSIYFSCPPCSIVLRHHLSRRIRNVTKKCYCCLYSPSSMRTRSIVWSGWGANQLYTW